MRIKILKGGGFVVGEAVLLIGLFAGSVRAEETPRVLTIGVVPQISPWALARRWTPFLRVWSRAAGVRIIFRTAPTIARFERRAARGDYDLVYLNPADYVRDRAHYRAFARPKGSLQGVLVVRKAGPIHDLAALSGHRLAFPARRAQASSIEIRRFLRQHHIAFRAHYVGSHDSVYRGVALGLFVAGGGIRQTLDAVAPDVRRQLRVLWASARTISAPFAARRSLPAPLVARLTVALLHLPAFEQLGFKGFDAVKVGEYRQAAVVP